MAMMIEEWATARNGVADNKVDYLPKFVVPWILKHVANKANMWDKIPKCDHPLQYGCS